MSISNRLKISLKKRGGKFGFPCVLLIFLQNIGFGQQYFGSYILQKKKKRVFWFLRIGFYNVFGWQEIRAREVLKRERGRRCPISPVWETEEIGKRDQFGVGPTLYLFSTKLRRKTRNCVFHCFLFFALALRKWKPIWRSGYYRFFFLY